MNTETVGTVLSAISKILELEELIETEIKKIGNKKRRKKFKKLCEKALKRKGDSDLANLREYMYRP